MKNSNELKAMSNESKVKTTHCSLLIARNSSGVES
jgi:hypothetical protein